MQNRKNKDTDVIGSARPPANYHRKPSVLMVDELLCAYPHQLSFSEAGMRIMITSHFSPRTRLTMASRMLITEVTEVALLYHFLWWNHPSRIPQLLSDWFWQPFAIQRQRLINTRTLTNGDSDVPVKGGSRRGVENGLSGAERAVGICHDDHDEGNETENEDNENNENDDEEADGEGPFVPFQCPGRDVQSTLPISGADANRSCRCSSPESKWRTPLLWVIQWLWCVFVVCVCSGCLQQTEVAVCLASLPAALLHRPQLLQTTLGELVHALLCLLHPVDRRVLLHHGLDGETRLFSINTMRRAHHGVCVLPKALEDPALLRAPALTALIFRLLSRLTSFLLLYCLYPPLLPVHSTALLVVALVRGSLGPWGSILFTSVSIAWWLDCVRKSLWTKASAMWLKSALWWRNAVILNIGTWESETCPSSSASGNCDRFYTGDPRRHHGHHFPGSWHQRPGLHGEPDRSTTR